MKRPAAFALSLLAFLPFALALAAWTDLPAWQYLALCALVGLWAGVEAVLDRRYVIKELLDENEGYLSEVVTLLDRQDLVLQMCDAADKYGSPLLLVDDVRAALSYTNTWGGTR